MLFSLHLLVLTIEPVQTTLVLGQLLGTRTREPLLDLISDSIGVFARAGSADGNVEPSNFTDIDRTVAGGVSLSGTRLGRPNDTRSMASLVHTSPISTRVDCEF